MRYSLAMLAHHPKGELPPGVLRRRTRGEQLSEMA
jgi:hypothetical protein